MLRHAGICCSARIQSASRLPIGRTGRRLAIQPGGVGAWRARLGLTATGRRNGFADDAVDEGVGPPKRHRRGRRHHKRKRYRRPDADRVVPVEIACLAAESPARDRHRADVLPGPRARHPQAHSRQHDHEEDAVRPTGDQLPHRAALALHPQPSVPRPHAGHHPSHAHGRFSENTAIIDVRVNRRWAERDRRRRRGIRLQRDCRRVLMRSLLSDTAQQCLNA